jgi:hypothetical protein
METNKPAFSWSALFLGTFLVAYLFIFNEWLFAVTKPSYLNDLGFLHLLGIYLTTSALLASLCFVCLLPLVILSLLPSLKRYTGLLVRLGSWLPAGIAATLVLLLVNNFTYTVFKFGVVSTSGLVRALYGLGFLALTFLCYRQTLKVLESLSLYTRRLRDARTFGLLAGVLVLSLAKLLSPEQAPALTSGSAGPTGTASRPHILLITADGVDASHTSLYGYERETTPRLQELAASSLVAENAFANFYHTTGSIVSIYTGKLPTQTHFYFTPPDILKGQDSYEHLPGLLLSQGYRTVQITIPLFLEANKVNLLDGFEEVKLSNAVYSRYLNKMLNVLPRDKALFVDEVVKRVVDRLRHIFFIERMTSPYLLVTKMSSLIVDTERWETLRQEVLNAREPLFIHIHLMVTHGKTFNPQVQHFSAGQSIQAQLPWNDDFYDDSILDFDRNVGELVDDLTDRGLLDNTILIIGTDHGQQWDLTKRLPLLIRFPNGQYAGRVRANVQNLDIAPTVLDYLGIDPPGWMAGSSLIDGGLEHRPIFSIASEYEELGSAGSSAVNQPGGHLTHKILQVTLIHCQKWFELEVVGMSWDSGNVQGSTSACPPGSQIDEEQVLQWILEHLQENGYEISDPDS